MKFGKKKKEKAWLLIGMVLLFGATSCGTTERVQTEGQIAGEKVETGKTTAAEPTTLIYGSGDYTRINPAMDEHGEINLLLLN